MRPDAEKILSFPNIQKKAGEKLLPLD